MLSSQIIKIYIKFTVRLIFSLNLINYITGNHSFMLSAYYSYNGVYCCSACILVLIIYFIHLFVKFETSLGFIPLILYNYFTFLIISCLS